jgi:2-polyprenyl-3-methyl-5-hydroxy-6-metoxy-1,4-benzoquinol methylase
MEEFWNNNHSNQNTYWLSSTYSGETILDLHNIDKNIKNIKVLDLGIGVGNLTRYLFKNGNKVYSCDISKVALNNVKDFASTYHTSELSKIEPVDLAISNLVFQHCNDKEIERMIKEVNLTDNGIFSFQFAFLRGGEPPNEKVQGFINKGTHHFRSLSTIQDMVDRGGKQVVYISEPIHYYGEENFSWYIIRIKNK